MSQTKTAVTVRQSDAHPDKQTVILEGDGLPWFRADAGTVSEGDTVRIENGSFAGVVE